MKVYELPDPAMSKLWLNEHDDEPMVAFFGDCGRVYVRQTGVSSGREPEPGRWLPVTLPTFPTREKAPMRLCTAIVKDHEGRQLLCWHDSADGASFRHHDIDVGWLSDGEVTCVEWLTPEYLDELVSP